MAKYCPNCGTQVADNATHCSGCGVAFVQPSMPQQGIAQPIPPAQAGAKSKICAGLLGIFLGGLGIHNFYLGYTGKAIAQLLLTLIVSPISCFTLFWIAPLWGLIEGILILSGAGITTDAKGIPLTQ